MTNTNLKLRNDFIVARSELISRTVLCLTFIDISCLFGFILSLIYTETWTGSCHYPAQEFHKSPIVLRIQFVINGLVLVE